MDKNNKQKMIKNLILPILSNAYKGINIKKRCFKCIEYMEKNNLERWEDT